MKLDNSFNNVDLYLYLSLWKFGQQTAVNKQNEVTWFKILFCFNEPPDCCLSPHQFNPSLSTGPSANLIRIQAIT